MRSEARDARRNHPDPEGAARTVCDAVIAHGWLDGVERMGATLADDGELDPAPLVAAGRARGAIAYFPVVCDSGPMRFAPAHPDTPMVPNRYGILEPDVEPGEWVSAGDLDLILAPLVVFDAAGNRAGRGRGYYDRALAFRLQHPHPARPVVVGLAYESQLVDAVPTHPGDVPVDAVVTEQHVRVFTPAPSLRAPV